MRFTNLDVENLIDEKRGNMAAIARTLGVTRSAVATKVKKSERLTCLVRSAKNSLTDDIEDALHEKALKGDIAAIIFYLKTQASDRGYQEKRVHEISGPDQGDIPIQFVDYRTPLGDTPQVEDRPEADSTSPS